MADPQPSLVTGHYVHNHAGLATQTEVEIQASVLGLIEKPSRLRVLRTTIRYTRAKNNREAAHPTDSTTAKRKKRKKKGVLSSSC